MSGVVIGRYIGQNIFLLNEGDNQGTVVRKGKAGFYNRLYKN